MTTNYEPTIGLEIHAELKTKTKMFCCSKNDADATDPNVNICPVCMAHPGTLPVINGEAVRLVLRVGLALGADLADYTEFDRKNYFYPDLPKDYQLSQYEYPLVSGGVLNDVAITRVHLEEDTASSMHAEGVGTTIDYNRAGVPLMELVTEPVIKSSKQAGDFARELQLLLRTLGASDANIEKGQMRVEANISISSTDELGTKVEVKNLNSFRSVEGAIAYEIERQRELLEKGEAVSQETRGWDEVRLKTFSQRSKETAKDYRYFPDPDIPKINTETYEYFSKARLSEILPELPSNKRINYENIGLPSKQIELLISVQAIDKIFAELYVAFSIKNPELLKLAANYLTSDVIALLGTDESAQIALKTENFAELMEMVLGGSINSRVAKDLLTELLFKNESPKAVATAKGLMQSSDPAALASLVAEVITENPTVVAEYLAGKETSIQFLIGQGMKKSRGTANPGVLTPLLKEALEASRKV